MNEEILKDKVEELEVEKLNEALEVEKQMKELEAFIQSNEGIFTYNKEEYKVIRPTLKIQNEMERYKMIHKIELIKDKSVMFESELKKLYKSRGIDIDGMEAELIAIESEIEELGEKALKAVGHNQEKLIKSIEVKKEKRVKIIYEKNMLLEGSLEQKLSNDVNIYTIHLVLQKEDENGKWVRMFKDFNSFENYEDNRLLLSAFNVLDSLLWNYEAE